PFHLQSFQSPFSLVDSNLVDRSDFFGGAFTADLGDRLGGFVDISTLAPEGEDRGGLELGTLNSRVTYRDPGAHDTTPWLVSARVWYPESVRSTTLLGGNENIDPHFADVYAKARFHLSA